MIYLTGDTHRRFTRFTKKEMQKNGLELGENDYVIVCGDFGLCWAKDNEFDLYCELFARLPYTILWVQGNHENYDMIEEYPIEEWKGGKVRHIVRDKVILLERGQVFVIEGKSFFTFGGAESHDMQGGLLDPEDINFKRDLQKAVNSGLPFRVKHLTWWEQELPSIKEMVEGIDNLMLVDCKVDYVITHCCSTSIQQELDSAICPIYTANILTDYLQQIDEILDFEHWYFGHYHMDMSVDEKHTLLYYDIIPLDGEVGLSEVHIPGKPKYKRGDWVKFIWPVNGEEKTGEVRIVDAYGTFEQNEEPSYDVYVDDGVDRCLCKHIRESKIIGKV